ncbi:hypothetical protein Gohar_002850 [Gossypium harknessii]|uniref:DUF4283 domain-containing protein n=1 Tax=Gossypium harknessii TaxID=34285 RepID=A0A7J9HND9_9ROSI|nr:hypothetical protein [Gossypium harknessii]
MEEELANLNLIDEEEDAFHEAMVVDQNYQFSLVGRCLTDSVVHFPSLCNTMVDLWHPIGRICISDLGEKRFLFQFFHDVDVQKVLSGTPRFFNNHLLFLQQIQIGEYPLIVSLYLSEFWVQIPDLPPGLMTETMAKQVGDILGQFLEYDTSILTMGIKKFMRIRIRLDVIILLKRKMKIQIGKDRTVYARFQYEKLSLFYFICGKLSHGESFCPFWIRIEPSKIVFGWDISLRVVVRWQNATVSKWLHEANGSECRLLDMERDTKGRISGEERDTGSNNRGDMEKSRELNGAGSDNGPMDLVLIEENEPLLSMEGKKRQRVVGDTIISSENNIEGGLHDITASSAGWSNIMQ